ncbi:MAG: CinA family protein [Eubacteriales bacterium]|nr:CinA family protein [Eubacteriales bacterium]
MGEKREPKEKPEETVIRLLTERGMKVTAVESCTGGMVCAKLTDVPGASKVFREGFVTYSDRAKRELVGVKKSTLKKHTAVSRQTAAQMARGGAKAAKADACISVTGYAGPEGGENGDPAGLVYIGCCVDGKVTVEEFHFSGDRRRNRQQAARQALLLLKRCILSRDAETSKKVETAKTAEPAEAEARP